MATTSEPEVWLRGPIAGIPPLLQPVAHALLQCREEMHAQVASLRADEIWAAPAGAASIGFHLRHAAGSLDRLFTYARGEILSAAQRDALRTEADPDNSPETARRLLAGVDEAVGRGLEQLRDTDPATLLEPRGVGRVQLPSTVLGLLFHGAEHMQRHAGQVVTTAKFVLAARR